MSEPVTCPMCEGAGVVDLATQRLLDDESAAARDQTTSDEDQTWSDHDQSASDRDERSAADDQSAADLDFASGSDGETHERTKLARLAASRDRESVSERREETATSRVRSAENRDRAADLRDRAADTEDSLARGEEPRPDATTEAVLVRAELARARAATDRVKAAEDRASAAADREEAARERVDALNARRDAHRDLLLAATDDLTGVWTRKYGLESVIREIERAGRTNARLVLAFIDVDDLKEVNDSLGHPEGDRLLRLVVDTLRTNVRPYDVIVRYGGDEFLCAMPNLSLAGAEERMEKIRAVLAAGDTRHSITFGLAIYSTGDELADLVGRADTALIAAKRARVAGNGNAA